MVLMVSEDFSLVAEVSAEYKISFNSSGSSTVVASIVCNCAETASINSAFFNLEYPVIPDTLANSFNSPTL